jgi:hypothetical protein
MPTTPDRASSVSETGGLPGANAAPAASEPTADDVITPPGNGPTSSTDVDSHDDGRGREGDAYDEPDDVSTPSGEELNDSADSFGQGNEAPDGPAEGSQFAG